MLKGSIYTIPDELRKSLDGECGWRSTFLTKTKQTESPWSTFSLSVSFYRKTKTCVVFINLILILHPIFSWMHKKISFFSHYFTYTLIWVKKGFHFAISNVDFHSSSVNDKCPGFCGTEDFPEYGISVRKPEHLSKMEQLVTSSFWTTFFTLTEEGYSHVTHPSSS